jgi:hypothetical protein
MMSEYTLYMATALMITLSAFVLHPAQAASHPSEFHEFASMEHKSFGRIDETYGYVYVTTDAGGAGTISVMFSNGSRLNGAKFNARVKFLDTSGVVIKEEYFNQRIAAADFEGAAEGKISKPLTFSNFDSIQVDFYLSDIAESSISKSSLQRDIGFSAALTSM